MILPPEKAVILAAGLGTRLRPLTWLIPKPMLPLWGVPLIEHTIRRLESWGVTEIAVNLHWQPEQTKTYLKKRKGRSAFTFFHEQEILGTGGALRQMGDFIKDSSFWLVNADIVFSINPQPLLTAFYTNDCIAAAWLDCKRGPRTVEVDKQGFISNFNSTKQGSCGTATFCGLQILSSQILEFIPPSPPEYSLISAYKNSMAAGRQVAGVSVPGSYWNDAGTFKNFLAVHHETRRLARLKKPGGELYLRANDASPKRRFFCSHPPGYLLPNKYLPSNCVIVNSDWRPSKASAKISNTIIAAPVWQHKANGVSVLPATMVADEPAIQATLKVLRWAPDTSATALLCERGSKRRFWRLADKASSAILVCYSTERPENSRYASHAALLAEAGVSVPALLVDLPSFNALVLEDWGDVALEQRMRFKRADVQKLYRPVLDEMIRLHTTATEVVNASGCQLEHPFDDALYIWEQELFITYMVGSWLGKSGPPPTIAEDFKAIRAKLLQAPHVLLHRDFQSSNVLLRNSKMAIIDFQGMRMGPAAYDLGSLLCDPYVIINNFERQQLIRYYDAHVGPEHKIPEFFDWAATQRLLQAMGAFGRLSATGFKSFEKYIPRAAMLLAECAGNCGLEMIVGIAREIEQVSGRRNI